MKQKGYFDAKHAAPINVVGLQVLLNNAHRNNRKGDKLAPRWVGPYTIEEVRLKGTYTGRGKKTLVNGMTMKPYNIPKGKVAVTIEADVLVTNQRTEDTNVVFCGEEKAEDDMVFTPVDKDMVFTPVDKDMVFTPVDEDMVFTSVDEDMVFTPVDEDMVFTPVDENMVFTPVDKQWQKVYEKICVHVIPV